MRIDSQLIALLVFPGLLFAVSASLMLEWIDRKIYARLQNRIGPPWYQPALDILKLLGKQDMLPVNSNARMIESMGIVAVASAVATMLYIPVVANRGALSFEGDLVTILFLLTLPTVAFYLAGWYSASPFGIIGAVRTASQFLAYEIPLTMALAAPALLSGSWSVAGIVEYSHRGPWMDLTLAIAFVVALIALQGKLERVPFDAPEAETEVVAGTFTELGGRRLALFRLASDIEMLAGSLLMANLFLGGPQAQGVLGLLTIAPKALLVVFVLSCTRAVTARLRTGQVVSFCWRVLVPASALQLALVFLLRGVVRS